MTPSLNKIQAAIEAGDKAKARRWLKSILQDTPTADGWVLAAQAMETEEQAISCLREALALDAWHTEANRLLHQLEGAKPPHELEREQHEPQAYASLQAKSLPPLRRNVKPDRFQRHAERQKIWRRLGCLTSILLSVSCSMFTFSLVGLLPGFIGTVTTLLGGPQPVYEIEGTPIEIVQDAPLVMTPALSRQAQDQSMEVMDHGYLHEYNFDARSGATFAVYVQFLSVSANRVSHNVVLIDPDGEDATSSCEQDAILDGDNGVTMVCTTDSAGSWAVRILGIKDESIGAYFVGVERLDF